MSRVPQLSKRAQRSSFESRLDWTICSRAKNKREAWQSDYVGVVRLSHPDGHYWVGVHLSNGIPTRLRLQEKDGRKNSFHCRLFERPFGRFEGQLQIAGIQLLARLSTDYHPESHLRRYRIHFSRRNGV